MDTDNEFHRMAKSYSVRALTMKPVFEDSDIELVFVCKKNIIATTV